MTLKLTKLEFEKFWDGALGPDWYVEDGACPEDEDPPEAEFDFDATWIGWQGRGKPKPTEFITARDLVDGMTSLEFEPIYKRWLKAQTHVTIVATFEVPHADADAIKKRIEEMGGAVKGGR